MKEFDVADVIIISDDNTRSSCPSWKNKKEEESYKLIKYFKSQNKETQTSHLGKFLKSWHSQMHGKLNTRPTWMLLIPKTTWKH